jgi:undecaprenyl-diphosphatase
MDSPMTGRAGQDGGKMSPAARAARAFKSTWLSLTDPRAPLDRSAWTRSMNWMALAALVAVAAAHLVDDSAVLFIRNGSSPLVHGMARITDVGQSQWYLVPAGLLFIAIAFLDWGARTPSGRSRLAFLFAQAGYAFSAVAFAGIIADIFKFLIGRARPKLFDDGGSLHFQPFTATHDFNSFPSGHSTTMGAVAIVLMVWFPRARVPLFLLCGFVAVTRIAARAHYPSDVVAGFALGSLYALFLARWLARRRVAFRFNKDALLPVPRFRLLARTASRDR